MPPNEEVTTPDYAVGSIKCTARDEEEGSIEYNFGADLDETIARYGADVVHYHTCTKFAVSMRNKFYSLLTVGDEPMSMSEAIAEMQGWVPKVSAGRKKKSPTDVALAAMDKMTPDQLREFIQTLKDSD